MLVNSILEIDGAAIEIVEDTGIVRLGWKEKQNEKEEGKANEVREFFMTNTNRLRRSVKGRAI